MTEQTPDPRATFLADQEAAQSEAAERDTQGWNAHLAQELAKAEAIQASAASEAAKGYVLNALALSVFPIAAALCIRLLRRPRR
jgi:hypothetical protein